MVIVRPVLLQFKQNSTKKELYSYVPDTKNGLSANSLIHEIAEPYNKIHINHSKTINLERK
jgi:hypothetical protein